MGMGLSCSGGCKHIIVTDPIGFVDVDSRRAQVGTAASFYLPLDRVKRAVDLLRQGKHVSRGTLQVPYTP